MTITTSTLVRAYRCARAAAFTRQQTEQYPGDQEEQQDSLQGGAFENYVLKVPENWLWILRRNDAGLKIPQDYQLKNKTTKLESDSQSDREQKITDTINWLQRLKPEEPAALIQGYLRIKTEAGEETGRPDVLLWNGTELIIVDVKHTTEARTEHSIQLYHYLTMLRAIIARSGKGTDIAKEGFLIHCPPRKLYSKRTSAVINKDCMTLVSFPLELTKNEYEECRRRLPPETAHGETVTAHFRMHCNRCCYRYLCFQKDRLSAVDRLPLPDSTLDAIHQNGIETITEIQLVLGTRSPATLYHEITKGNKTSADYLAKLCSQISTWGRTFEWHPPKSWKENYWLYARDFNLSAIFKNDRTKMHGHAYKRSNEIPQTNWPGNPLPEVIVCFTGEEKNALRKIINENKQLKQDYGYGTILCLNEELARIHKGPVIGTTIEGYTKTFMNGLNTAESLLINWSERRQQLKDEFKFADWSKESASAMAVTRVNALEKLWKILWELTE